MLIDTSVLVAIYNKESGFEELLRIIAAAKRAVALGGQLPGIYYGDEKHRLD